MRIIPYGKHSISEDDIQAVVNVLRTDWLTQGPMVERFERAIADYCGTRYAVAVANGTAALHLSALAAGFGPGDEIITTPITFVASANCIAYTSAKPVFSDIDPYTYCIDPEKVDSSITPSTRGLIPVHFTGQPCDMATLNTLACQHDLVVIEDAAHALGASYKIGNKTYRIGSCAHSDMTIFSFHPVKHITTGEGGMITTNSKELYKKLITLRTHGITRNPEILTNNEGPWYYEQQMLGFNYRISDIQCALGISQLQRLDEFIARRKEISEKYNKAFQALPELILPEVKKGVRSSWHLYVLGFKNLDRKTVFQSLKSKGISVNVHYIPVHLQPYYKEKYGYRKGEYPQAEKYYERSLTLPLFPGLSDTDVHFVITSVKDTISELSR